jgi:hypothetical protein
LGDSTSILSYQSVRTALILLLDDQMVTIHGINFIMSPADFHRLWFFQQCKCYTEKLQILDHMDFCAKVMDLFGDNRKYRSLLGERKDVQSILDLLQQVGCMYKFV